MLIDWLIEGGEQLKLLPRTVFHAVVLHDRYMDREANPIDFSNGLDEIDNFMVNALACLFISAKNNEIDTQMAHSGKFLELLPIKSQQRNMQKGGQFGSNRPRKSQRLYDAELKILQDLGWDCQQMTTFS